MIKAHMKQERAAPLWAAVGAPLLGVPLMVALLAFTVSVETPVVEPDAAVCTEQVEVQAVDRPLELDADCMELAPQRG